MHSSALIPVESHLLNPAGIIKLQLRNDTARLQHCPSSLHIVNAARLARSESHHHLHYLDRDREREESSTHRETEGSSTPSRFLKNNNRSERGKRK